jgi:hypothetical protein
VVDQLDVHHGMATTKDVLSISLKRKVAQAALLGNFHVSVFGAHMKSCTSIVVNQ